MFVCEIMRNPSKKGNYFSTADQSFEKTLSIFLLLGSIGVSVHNFVLEPCAILK